MWDILENVAVITLCYSAPLQFSHTGTFFKSPFLRRPVYATCSISPVTAIFWTVICDFVAGAGLEVAGSGFQTMVPPQVLVAGSSQKLSQVPVSVTC